MTRCFKCEIELENSAMLMDDADDVDLAELAHTLKHIAKRLDRGEGIVRDFNGNTIGKWKVQL